MECLYLRHVAKVATLKGSKTPVGSRINSVSQATETIDSPAASNGRAVYQVGAR